MGAAGVRGDSVDKNVEIKAKANNSERQRRLVEELAHSRPRLFYQEGTFLNCSVGRLKLRPIPNGAGELIYYEREDWVEPTKSEYVLYPTNDPNDPETLKAALSNALGVRAVVSKNRRVFVVGRTRTHLDEVEGPGYFIELEVMLRPGESQENGVEVAEI